jgi:alkylhydroperoxidase/carboxymuconolactone decarboxylase family protein YurZ
MGMQSLLTQIKPYADDIKKSLRKLFVEYHIPGLTKEEAWSVGLAAAYTLRNTELTEYFESYVRDNMEDTIESEHIETMKALVTVMTVKNTYNKAIFKSCDEELGTHDPHVSEDIMFRHDEVDERHFHLYALSCAAVSASQICMQQEIDALRKLGVDNHAIHTVITIAAVLKGASQALHMS